MSNRERVQAIVAAMPEYQIDGLLAFLSTLEDTPNGETVAALQEVDRMIQDEAGQHFTGSTGDLFHSLLEE